MIRLAPSAGIAIGPILFVIALLGILAMTMSQNIGDFGVAGRMDRTTTELRSQANLIRSKINECNMLSTGKGGCSTYWPTSTGAGTLVSELECACDGTTDKNIWTGQRPAQLPPPPQNFADWYYVNGGASGGRCIRIQPTNTTIAADAGIKAGIAKAATHFATNEVSYTSGSTGQRFVIWITRATGTPDANCSSS
jgi:hypothetical protein